MKTGYKVRQVRVMWARCDYILGTDRRYFEILGIRVIDISHSDHFDLRTRLLIFPTEAGHHFGASGLSSQIGAVYGGREEYRS